MKGECPICKKTFFEEEFEICDFCGWEHDILQEKEPTFSGGANDLSLVEFKEIYTWIIKEHSNYKWLYDKKYLDQIISKFEYPPYMCKCCKKEMINSTGEKCCNCGWIDSQLQNCYKDVGNLINQQALNDYKKN